MKTFTAPLLRELIDHIDVYEKEGTGKNKTQRLVIFYKFVGYLDVSCYTKKPSFVEDTRQGVAVEYVSCEPISDIFEEDTEEEDLIDSIDVSDEKQPEKKTG